MITGFNPGDMYAADHIRRVLRTFPGVFSGIGEFTIHKEFVSDKVRPGPASLSNPALDSVLSAGGRDRSRRAHPQRHGRAVRRRLGDAKPCEGCDEVVAIPRTSTT